MSKKFKDTDYLYLSAMVRARQARMLTDDKLRQIADADSFADAARQVSEYGYPDMSGLDAAGIDAELNRRRDEIFYELGSMKVAAAVADIFRARYDYHNVKVLVKAAGAADETLISNSGRYSLDVLSNAYYNDDTDAISPATAEAMTEGKSVFARTGDPQLADIAVDKAYFKELLELADVTGSDFIRGYVRLMIDSANLRTAVRVMRMGKNVALAEAAFIEGGDVDVSAMTAEFTADNIAECFAPTALAEAAEAGRIAIGGGSMTVFELKCDDAVNGYMSTASFVSFGVSPVIAYLASVENELSSVRMILTGKLSGVQPKAIRERLRKCYV